MYMGTYIPYVITALYTVRVADILSLLVVSHSLSCHTHAHYVILSMRGEIIEKPIWQTALQMEVPPRPR